MREDDEVTFGSGAFREERRKDPSRVLALTDGVFAIIITLLVLDIHVPELSAHEHLRTAIAEVRPSFPPFAALAFGLGQNFVDAGPDLLPYEHTWRGRPPLKSALA